MEIFTAGNVENKTKFFKSWLVYLPGTEVFRGNLWSLDTTTRASGMLT